MSEVAVLGSASPFVGSISRTDEGEILMTGNIDKPANATIDFQIVSEYSNGQLVSVHYAHVAFPTANAVTLTVGGQDGKPCDVGVPSTMVDLGCSFGGMNYIEVAGSVAIVGK